MAGGIVVMSLGPARVPVVVLLAAFLELHVIAARVPFVAPEAFERAAPVIAVRGPVRLGYVCLHHGCVPVWTFDALGVTSPDPRQAPTAPDWDRRIRRALVAELRDLPRQALTELAVVAALAGWWIWCVPGLRRLVLAPDAPGARARWRSAGVGALAGVGSWLILLAPALCLGYGTFRQTNQIGPGALAVTVGGPPLLLGPGALAYRIVLLLTSAPAILIAIALDCDRFNLAPRLTEALVALLGAAVYGALGAAWFAMVRRTQGGST